MLVDAGEASGAGVISVGDPATAPLWCCCCTNKIPFCMRCMSENSNGRFGSIPRDLKSQNYISCWETLSAKLFFDGVREYFLRQMRSTNVFRAPVSMHFQLLAE